MATYVRDYRPADADEIVALFNRHRDVSNPVDGGISAGQFAQELADRDTHTFLVAMDDDTIVGTFGLFRSDGRRVAEPGELIADMYFVAPAHRTGMLTPELFATAIERVLHEARYDVMRLTVNPANSPAFTLYRRVGCLALDRSVPGADGNVPLYNFLPLVFRELQDTFTPGMLRELTAQRIASIPRPVPLDMSQDVRVEDDRRVVTVPFAVGDTVIEAIVDIDNRVVLRATAPGFDYRPEPEQLPDPVPSPSGAAPKVVLREGDLELNVHADGTTEVWRDGHLGPVWTSFWPTTGRGRVTGWRAGNHRDVRVRARADGSLDLVERLPAATLTVNVGLDAEGLTQRYAIDGTIEPPARAYQVAGLRSGRLRIGGRDSAIGDGMGVRDTGQVPVAQAVLDEGTQVQWTAPGDCRVTVVSPGSFGLVSGTVAELRDITDGTTLRVRVGSAPARVAGSATGEQADQQPGTTRRPVTPRAPVPGTVRPVAEAGGLVAWKPFGRNVFRSPYPRTRSFASNPEWSAGLWSGGDVDRYDRGHGPGWGVVPATGWRATSTGLQSDSVRLDVGEDCGDEMASLRLTVDGRHDEPETVVWLTPDTPGSGVISCFSPYDDVVDSHDLGEEWTRWTRAVSVPLRDGRWLTVSADPESPAKPEILVRSRKSGVLVTATARTGSGPVCWSLDVTERPLTSWRQLPAAGLRAVAA